MRASSDPVRATWDPVRAASAAASQAACERSASAAASQAACERSASARPSPVPCGPVHAVPDFAPLRVGRSGDRLRRAVRRRRRVVGAGLAVAAAALAATAGSEAQASRGAPPPQPPPVTAAVRKAPPVALVSAPVRIADGATVRLLRPGDRVDVVAAERDGPPRVLAEAARVAEVPTPDKGVGDGGALVVLSVPRDTARALVGAGTVARLAVTLC